MRIGLLQCGHFAPEFRTKIGDHSDLFLSLFKKYAPEISLDVFDVQNKEYPADEFLYDGFLGTGSSFSVYGKDPWDKEFKGYVKKLYRQKIKFIGICFGHQMIAEALGGRCAKSDKGWEIGIKKVTIQENQSWMKPEADTCSLIVIHEDQIEELPLKGEIIGSSDLCPCSMITVGNHFLGIQGHPEFTPAYLEMLMALRVDRIGPKAVEEAKKTLKQKADEALVTRWMVNFFSFRSLM